MPKVRVLVSGFCSPLTMRDHSRQTERDRQTYRQTETDGRTDGTDGGDRQTERQADRQTSNESIGWSVSSLRRPFVGPEILRAVTESDSDK